MSFIDPQGGKGYFVLTPLAGVGGGCVRLMTLFLSHQLATLGGSGESSRRRREQKDEKKEEGSLSSIPSISVGSVDSVFRVLRLLFR
jgi:hypothetical protein